MRWGVESNCKKQNNNTVLFSLFWIIPWRGGQGWAWPGIPVSPSLNESLYLKQKAKLIKTLPRSGSVCADKQVLIAQQKPYQPHYYFKAEVIFWEEEKVQPCTISIHVGRGLNIVYVLCVCNMMKTCNKLAVYLWPDMTLDLLIIVSPPPRFLKLLSKRNLTSFPVILFRWYFKHVSFQTCLKYQI